MASLIQYDIVLVQLIVPGQFLLHIGFPYTVGYSSGAVHCPWACFLQYGFPDTV